MLLKSALVYIVLSPSIQFFCICPQMQKKDTVYSTICVAVLSYKCSVKLFKPRPAVF